MLFHKHTPSQIKQALSQICYCGLLSLACKYEAGIPSKFQNQKPRPSHLTTNSTRKYRLSFGHQQLMFKEKYPEMTEDSGYSLANPTDLELSIARLVINHTLDVGPVADEDLSSSHWDAVVPTSQRGSTHRTFNVNRCWPYRYSTQPHTVPAITKGSFCCARSVTFPCP